MLNSLMFSRIKSVVKGSLASDFEVNSFVTLPHSDCYETVHEKFGSEPIIGKYNYVKLWFRFLKIWRGRIILLQILAICTYGLSIISPWFIKYIIDEFKNPKSTLASIFLGLFAYTFMKCLFTFCQRHMFASAGNTMFAIAGFIRGKVSEKWLNLNNHSAEKTSASELFSMTGMDAQRIGSIAFAHDLWVLPLGIIGASCGLWLLLGNIAFVGNAIIFIGVVANLRLNIGLKHRFSMYRSLFGNRIDFVSETLGNIQSVHALAWEGAVVEAHNSKRQSEQKVLISRQKYVISIAFINSMLPILAISAIFAGKYFLGETIQVANFFAAMGLLESLKLFLGNFPAALNLISESRVAAMHFCDYLQLADSSTENYKINLGKDNQVTPSPEIHLNSVKIAGGTKQLRFEKNYDAHVKLGQVVCICGTVGVGKSLLLSAISGMLPLASGSRELSGRVGYLPQETWLINSTLKNNITMFRSTTDEIYLKVLNQSQLSEDFENKTLSDDFAVGENGANLSEGQRQRICLARVLLENPEIIVLDEPFSALDPTVTEGLFKAIQQIANNRAICIIASNNTGIQQCADQVWKIADTGIIEVEVRHFTCLNALKKETTQNDLKSNDNLEIQELPALKIAPLSESERKYSPTEGLQDIYSWLKGIGNAKFAVIILGLFLFVGISQVAAKLILAKSIGSHADAIQKTLTIFTGVLTIAMLSEGMRNWIVLKSSVKYNSLLLYQALSSSLNGIKQTWSGHKVASFLGAFSQDTQVLDLELPSGSIRYLNVLVSLLILMLTFLSKNILALPLFIVSFLMLRKMIYNSSRCFKRIGNYNKDSKAVFIARFQELLRSRRHLYLASGKQSALQYLIQASHDVQRSMYNFNLVQRYFMIRQELLGHSLLFGYISIWILSSSFFLEKPDGAEVGIFFVLLLSATECIRELLVCHRDVDIQMISFRRLVENIVTVKDENIVPVKDENILSSSNFLQHNAPHNFNLQNSILQNTAINLAFSDLSFSYSTSEVSLFKDLSLDIPKGSFVTIGGRTGSGKTSLFNCVVKISRPLSGAIFIEGHDTNLMTRESIAKKVGYISQNPLLFSAQLRWNLNPSGTISDEALRESLRISGVDKILAEKKIDLNSELQMRNQILSPGEKQLIALSRAYLHRTPILLLDEPTARLDVASKQRFWVVLDKYFSDVTRLAILHDKAEVDLKSDLHLQLDNGRFRVTFCQL